METTTETKPKRTRTPKASPTAAEAWTKRDFGIIAKMFEAETAEVQAGLIAVSGMLQLVKNNLKEQPLVISYLVRKAQPGLTEAVLLTDLQSGVFSVGLSTTITGDDLPSFLTNLNECTVFVPDENWNIFWHGMFCAISAPLLPWSKVVVYSEYVYQVLVKPSVK